MVPLYVQIDALRGFDHSHTLNANPEGSSNGSRQIFCGERGSNTWPSDLQSDALPTELSPHFLVGLGKKMKMIYLIVHDICWAFIEHFAFIHSIWHCPRAFVYREHSSNMCFICVQFDALPSLLWSFLSNVKYFLDWKWMTNMRHPHFQLWCSNN